MINNLKIERTGKSYKLIVDGVDIANNVLSANIRFDPLECFPLLEIEMPFARCEVNCDMSVEFNDRKDEVVE